MFFTPRRSGIGLTGILIIGAVLYYTGAFGWLWGRVKELGGACYSLMDRTGTTLGTPLCDGITRIITQLDENATGLLGNLGERITGGSDIGQYAQGLFERITPGNSTLAGLVSPGDKLQEMMDGSPELSSMTSGAHDRLQAALDQFVIGQHYLQDASPSKAVPWFKESAEQPGGYGVLSQLTLGDMYKNGNGVAQDSGAASSYYQQAIASISSLQASNSPQAGQLLGSLPAQPEQMKAALQEQMRQLGR